MASRSAPIPGYPDLVGFGRRDLDMAADELEASIVYQVGAVAAFAADAGVPLRHVKPHGALYNAAARNPELAACRPGRRRACRRRSCLVGLAGSSLIDGGPGGRAPDRGGGLRRPGVRGRWIPPVAAARRRRPRGPGGRRGPGRLDRPRRPRHGRSMAPTFPSAPTRSASTATAPARRTSPGRSGRRSPRPASRSRLSRREHAGGAGPDRCRWASRRCS